MKHISTNTLRTCTKCGADARYAMECTEDVPDSYYEDENGELQMRLRLELQRASVCEAHMYDYLDKNYTVIADYTYFITPQSSQRRPDEEFGDYLVRMNPNIDKIPFTVRKQNYEIDEIKVESTNPTKKEIIGAVIISFLMALPMILFGLYFNGVF